MFAFLSVTLFVAVCVAATCSHLHELEMLSTHQALGAFGLVMLGWAVGAALRAWAYPAVLRTFASSDDSEEPVQLCILEKHLPGEHCTACIPAWIGTPGDKPARVRSWPVRRVSREGGTFRVCSNDVGQLATGLNAHDSGFPANA